MDELLPIKALEGIGKRVALIEGRLSLFLPLILADIVRDPEINRPGSITLPEIKYLITARYAVTDEAAPGGQRECTITTSVSTNRIVEKYMDELNRPCIRITYQITITVKDSCEPADQGVTLKHTKTEIKCGSAPDPDQQPVFPPPPDDEPATGDTTRLNREKRQTLIYPDGTRITVTTSADGKTVTIDVQYPDGTTDQTRFPHSR